MPRVTLKPATGVCRWVQDAPNGNRQLLINGTCYEVWQTPTGFCLGRLDDEQGTVVYRIECDPQVVGLWTCNCPDSTNRPERRGCCKHVRALRAAWAKLPL